MFILKGYEEDQEDNEEEEGGLSQSGKELRKLLGKNSGVNESEPEQEDDDDDDIDDESSLFLHQRLIITGSIKA
ncbi:putative transcription initiation factor IIF, alpha subunit [Helianthus annuus]|uniref:Transcription initiation factor IIF subunit alpha n=1 Tax=Helianthus annuus TaxID=4232 RepID=A0A251V614_HELAN|nr:putative transcription initiation factor IIF, alpha subunit [Helianthus annuus]KAJ0927866.1 putative transcription initiation factor IIF, alpha subunit [Helianthus annuus]